MRSRWGGVGRGGRVVAATGACGESRAPLPGVDSCSSAWQVVMRRGDNELWPEQLAWDDGRIYYPSVRLAPSTGVDVVPEQGGEPTRLIDDWATRVWPQPDRI